MQHQRNYAGKQTPARRWLRHGFYVDHLHHATQCGAVRCINIAAVIQIPGDAEVAQHQPTQKRIPVKLDLRAITEYRQRNPIATSIPIASAISVNLGLEDIAVKRCCPIGRTRPAVALDSTASPDAYRYFERGVVRITRDRRIAGVPLKVKLVKIQPVPTRTTGPTGPTSAACKASTPDSKQGPVINRNRCRTITAVATVSPIPGKPRITKAPCVAPDSAAPWG